MASKIKFFPIIIIIFLALFALGAQIGCNSKTTSITFNATALKMSFVENAPPTQINPGTPIAIYIKAENVGGYDMAPETANFYLSGVGNNLRNIITPLPNSVLLSKKTPMQEGSSEVIKFADRAELAVQLVNPTNISIRADSCYGYATTTQATICIGPGSSICSISGEKIITGSNTNAPVQITSLTEQIQGNKIYISFKIENKGAGDAYYTDLDCDKLFGQDSSARVQEGLKKNVVDIYIETEPDITCTLQSPSGSITGTSGKASIFTSSSSGKITCSKTIGQETHSAVIKVNMAYKYVEGISKQISLLPA